MSSASVLLFSVVPANVRLVVGCEYQSKEKHYERIEFEGKLDGEIKQLKTGHQFDKNAFGKINVFFVRDSNVVRRADLSLSTDSTNTLVSEFFVRVLLEEREYERIISLMGSGNLPRLINFEGQTVSQEESAVNIRFHKVTFEFSFNK